MKTELRSNAWTPRPFGAPWVLSLPCLAGLLLSSTLLPAAVPADPIAEIRFSEGPPGAGGPGITTASSGSLLGTATFAQPDDPIYENGSPNIFPAFTNKVPTGLYVPAMNDSSVDFGPGLGNSMGGSHGRAIDLSTDLGPAHPTITGNTLGECPKLTICGWLNTKQITGLTAGDGNRIAYALESDNSYGFELVQRAAGQISLAVNENASTTPDSVGVLTADAAAGDNNWIYFAVTYDPSLASDQVKYYFGRHNKLAQLDVARTYVGGPSFSKGPGYLEFTGLLTLGNFGVLIGARDGNIGGNNNRFFKGLMDEIRVYTNALTIDEIQQCQVNAVVTPVGPSILTQPVNASAIVGQNVSFNVDVTGSGLVTYQWHTNGTAVPGATGRSLALTGVLLAQNGTTVHVAVSNAVDGVLSDTVTLTVIQLEPSIISHSFGEGSGTTTINSGSLAGFGKFKVSGGFPTFNPTNVPSGLVAPSAVHNISLNNGLVAANRAVDLTNTIVSPIGALGSMSGLTICGWLNSANNTFRTTSTGRGAAIVNASLGGSLGGFVLVYRDNAFSGNNGGWNLGSNGRLVLHVNEWKTDSVAGQASSADTIPFNADLPPENWVFFAVTYDGEQATDNLNFYFGNANTAAALDVMLSYNKGVIASSGPLSIGSHNSTGDGVTATPGNPTGRTVGGDNGTSFRGLMDEIKVFTKVLTLSEIQECQVEPAMPPRLVFNLQPPNLGLSWQVATPFQLQCRTNVEAGVWEDVMTAPTVMGNIFSVDVPIGPGRKFFRLVED